MIVDPAVVAWRDQAATVLADALEEITADSLEEVFHAALAEGDVKGVDSALRLLAVKDPRRAQHLLDLTKLALHLAQGRPGQEKPDAS